TRFSRDWSSDVCSSDLGSWRFRRSCVSRAHSRRGCGSMVPGRVAPSRNLVKLDLFIDALERGALGGGLQPRMGEQIRGLWIIDQIGRASCREREEISMD